MYSSIIAIAKTMNYTMFISHIPMLTLSIRYRFFVQRICIFGLLALTSVIGIGEGHLLH